ncbi:MAG: hypothetical protein AAGK98_06490 [Pseudomonadota bacterium]
MADSYADALTRYRALMSRLDGIEVKGKANPYTSMNGNMFSFLDKAGVLCLRLSAKDRDGFVRAYGTDPVEQYGAVMKEYVAVPADLFADDAALMPHLMACLGYARTLPVKPTKKTS